MSFSLYLVWRYAGAAALFLGFAATCVFAQSAPPQTLLPPRFSGWAQTGIPNTGSSPAIIDPDNAGALAEYGLKNFSESTYRHGNSQATLRALRFADATGAYGAYTFYRKPDMKPVAIGNNGAADSREVVVRSGVTVIDASFDSPVTNEQSALKNLIAELPPSDGPTGVAPSLPQYLPSSGLDPSTVHYAIGPVAYTHMGGVLPPSLIDFSRDAEAVTADYSFPTGRGTLTILEYPTPQMAIESEKAISAMLKGSLPLGLQQTNAATLAVKRSGPLVAITSGDMPGQDAQVLLDKVKYQADVTWNRPGNSGNEVKNAAEMLLGIAYLTGIIVVCAISIAVFLGGGRAAWRVMRGKPASTVYEEDFISLNLNNWQRKVQ